MIYFMKLRTGEWLVSEASPLRNGNWWRLTNPQTFRMRPTEDGKQTQVALVPYIPFDATDNIDVNKDEIVAYSALKDGKMVDLYKQATSPIDIVQKPGIITPR